MYPVSVSLCLLTLAACGGQDAEATGSSATAVEVEECAEASVAPPSEYPEGPFSTMANPRACSIVPNVNLRGFFNPDGVQLSAELELGDYSLQTLRETGARYLMVHTAATWCPSCQDSAFALGAELRPDVDALREQGAMILELVVEHVDGSMVGPPDDDALRAWATAYDLNVSVLAPDIAGLEVFRTREYAYVIELATMQVVWNSGFLLYRDPSRAGIDALKAIL